MDIPNSAAEEPPIIGSGMETNTAPNFPKIPKNNISKALALITRLEPTWTLYILHYVHTIFF